MENNLLIYGTDSKSQRISPLLSEAGFSLVGRVDDEHQVLESITKYQTNVLAICSEATEAVLRVCQQIFLLRPRMVVILFVDSFEIELLQKIIQTGIHHVVPTNIEPILIVNRLRTIISNESYRMKSLENETKQQTNSNVVLTMSSKGGVGKTTVSCNLAIQLARMGYKVALLDFSFSFGDISTVLCLKDSPSIVDLLQENATPTLDMIRRFMQIHTSGVNVLVAPKTPELGEGINTSQISNLVVSLKNGYDFVVIDLETGISEINLSCIDISRKILLLSDLTIPCLKQTKKTLMLFASLGSLDKVSVVISKKQTLGISVKDARNALELPIFHDIPFESKFVIQSLNQGIPVVLSKPNCSFSKSLNELAAKLSLPLIDEGKKKRFYNKINWKGSRK